MLKVCWVTPTDQTFSADVYTELRLRTIALTSNAAYIEECLRVDAVELMLMQFINADGDLEDCIVLSKRRADSAATLVEISCRPDPAAAEPGGAAGQPRETAAGSAAAGRLVGWHGSRRKPVERVPLSEKRCRILLPLVIRCPLASSLLVSS
ncbi:hypothetical protein EON64_19030 [archaeon]|nr:MAG: hypothetical protein EON64_19030 [archaeon]